MSDYTCVVVSLTLCNARDPLMEDPLGCSQIAELVCRQTMHDLRAVFAHSSADCITLVLHPTGCRSNRLRFEGRREKIIAVASAVASSCLMRKLSKSSIGFDPDKLPYFEARAHHANEEAAARMVLTASRLAVGRLLHRIARDRLGSAQNNRMNDVIAALDKKGISFNNDYSSDVRKGIFLRRFFNEPTDEVVLSKAPADIARVNIGTQWLRNPVDVVIGGAKPIYSR